MRRSAGSAPSLSDLRDSFRLPDSLYQTGQRDRVRYVGSQCRFNLCCRMNDLAINSHHHVSGLDPRSVGWRSVAERCHRETVRALVTRSAEQNRFAYSRRNLGSRNRRIRRARRFRRTTTTEAVNEANADSEVILRERLSAEGSTRRQEPTKRERLISLRELTGECLPHVVQSGGHSLSGMALREVGCHLLRG